MRKKRESEEGRDFENAMERLAAVVARLEGGECGLDESLKLYEEGAALVKVCSARLDEVEKRLKTLVERDGKAAAEPASPAEPPQ